MQNPSANLIFILFLFAILYFLMWRPQQRRIRAMQALQSSLQLGDEIITTAGFLGTIRRFDGEVVTIELSPGVEARVNRRAISGRLGPDRADEPADEAEEDEERPGP
jgi:preprotein translocase subunit YajC